MQKVLKSKYVSYGLVELIDAETSYARYRIVVNGSVNEVSDDLNFMIQTFNNKYY